MVLHLSITTDMLNIFYYHCYLHEQRHVTNKMNIISLLTGVFIWWLACTQSKAFAVTRAKEYRGSGEVASKDGVNAEPSCEELKAMWRFSKRQSRAAEVTNEIPTYRDPFSYNMWEPYYVARSRSIGGLRLGGRYRSRPIYGRVVHKPPIFRVQDIAERNRAFEELARMYGTVPRGAEPRRRVTAFRLSGGGNIPTAAFTPQSGSFQHLKELIRTERARELQEQRMAEEAAAQAAALKDNGGVFRNQASLHDMNYNYDPEGHDEQNENYEGHSGIMVFPDLLADSYQNKLQMEDYYDRDGSYPRSHSSALFGSSSLNNEMDGMIL
ncbi:hypothetical protein RN001_016135 [Aquatica leii]|uniref:Uncharacterized protein n=1 Tax=Aquatica leii TaxID=1421715 RepID=A0AAN7S601_9COLE|nr:hypothetical protein RN001_016135 [Aquatica leii]